MKTRLVLAIVLALILAAVFAPIALATPWTAASGHWSWENLVTNVHATPNGTTILTGAEAGTWTGTFSGTAYEDFFALIRPSGDLWATLTIHFTGTVDGVGGTMTMKVTAYAAAGTGTSSGRWVIQNGSGGLKQLHGQGTWVSPPDYINAADYSGMISMR